MLQLPNEETYVQKGSKDRMEDLELGPDTLQVMCPRCGLMDIVLPTPSNRLEVVCGHCGVVFTIVIDPKLKTVGTSIP